MTESKEESVKTPPPLELRFRIDNPDRVLYYSSLILLVFILIRNLWVSDDAFITLRTVDNFLHGYGLVWNIGERVQVFTHPLWMFLLVIFAFLIPSPLYVFYVPSLLLSIWLIVLLIRNFAGSTTRMILAVILFGGSMSFIDYSSSGLENPLTHFLLALFLIQYFKDEPDSRMRLFKLSLLAGLAALNRLDTVVFYLPALFEQFMRQKDHKWQAVLALAAGFLPILVWEFFALYYYGFPFPNTYYVKAATGLPTSLLFKQGAVYIQNSFHWDPLTLGAVWVGMLSVFWQRETRRISIALGGLLYLFYILWIGGDFMSGRFFSGVFLIGWVLLMTFDAEKAFGSMPRQAVNLMLAFLAIIGFSADRPPLLMYASQPGMSDYQFGIANEKYYYFGGNGWLNYIKHGGLHELAYQGMMVGQAKETPVEMNTIGMYGYYAGPDIYIIDSYALSDPLRAHIPVNVGMSRVGHYDRGFPAGYLETIQADFKENLIQDSNLRLYFDKLSILTRADLNAPGRLLEIVRFNTGYYDVLMEKYWQTVLIP